MRKSEKRLIQICFEMDERANIFKHRVELTQKLASLSVQGKKGTPEWNELKRKVDYMKTQVFDISTQMDEINRLLKSLNKSDYE